MEQIFYAKSEHNGIQPTVRDHLAAVAEAAGQFAAAFDCEREAYFAGLFHDFGKYSQSFQDVLKHKRDGIDHAVCGAVVLNQNCRSAKTGKLRHSAWKPIIEAINGHHDGLRDYESIYSFLKEIIRGKEIFLNNKKRPALIGVEEYQAAYDRFCGDFAHSPCFPLPKLKPLPEEFKRRENPDLIGRMLYTRMLFSCLVDADYSISASDEDPRYLRRTTNDNFNPEIFLEKLHAYRRTLHAESGANSNINHIRDSLFIHCGDVGEHMPEGLFTLSAPTGTGKTLALLHFALRHCSEKHAALFPAERPKRRIILVLPFLTLADQSADIYQKIFPPDTVLIDHSQSNLPDEARDFANRWSVPIIITTTVKFFESLFASCPTDCRKLHHIANSVILFDEAQSLPPQVTQCTLQSVNELCLRYHCTMVFSTATQPTFEEIPHLSWWKPREILPKDGELSPTVLYHTLRRVRVDWRLDSPISLEALAVEMSKQDSVCAIVNLRSHARKLYRNLRALCLEEEIFFLTTDLCPAHRRETVRAIQERLRAGKTCRVVATQCIEAGVDLDFDAMYRALAPLDAIIQAAGRCNRNGRLNSGGQVTVFIPDEELLYPGNWYFNAAECVKSLAEQYKNVKYLTDRYGIDIDDREHIRQYYASLLWNTRDKPELTRALNNCNFQETDKQYKLIDQQYVCRVLVPYSPLKADKEHDLFQFVAQVVRREGGVMTKELMKAIRKANPVIVSTMRPDKIADYVEPLYFIDRDGVKTSSGYYLLSTQWEKLYDLRMGLQLPDPVEDAAKGRSILSGDSGFLF